MTLEWTDHFNLTRRGSIMVGPQVRIRSWSAVGRTVLHKSTYKGEHLLGCPGGSRRGVLSYVENAEVVWSCINLVAIKNWPGVIWSSFCSLIRLMEICVYNRCVTSGRPEGHHILDLHVIVERPF